MKSYDKNNLVSWYQNVLTDADAFIYGPAKGSIFFLPFATAVWNQIKSYLNSRFSKLNVEEVNFPSLIPLSAFEAEKDFAQGFNPELYLIKQIGPKEISDPLVLRPTSEILFSHYFQQKIKSYKNLPVLLNQWCSVYRAEQNTKPFFRNSEFLWQEGHTLHLNEAAARDFILKIHQVYCDLISDQLALAPLSGLKTELEKFAGAQESLTHEIIMPDGQVLQSATSHYLGDNFTKSYQIKIQNKENNFVHPVSTSWGISSRIMGALFMAHGDDFGLVLPPKIAPCQVFIATNKKDLFSNVKELASHLDGTFRVKFNFNLKFKQLIEKNIIQGTPLQLHVYEKEILLYNRLTNSKKTVTLENIIQLIQTELMSIQTELAKRAQMQTENKICILDDPTTDINRKIKEKKVIKVPFSLDWAIEQDLMAKSGISVRCIAEPANNKKCFFNQKKPAKNYVYIGRSY